MIWRTKEREIDLTNCSLIMGVLNVTVDSFSDGGRFLAIDRALAHAMEMITDGAYIIDVGGESTRPGSEPVDPEVELARVLPVIEELARTTNCLISIDTSKAVVADAALAKGASIINDVTGLHGDPAMIKVAQKTGSGIIAMHMQGTPRNMQQAPHYEDVVSEIREFFRQINSRAIRCGIDPMCMAFDPGIGFGKTLEHNLLLLKQLAHLRIDERPLVLGVSRKSFIGKVIGTDEMAARFWPTVALTSLARESGANILRVHDVKANHEALRMTEAILNVK